MPLSKAPGSCFRKTTFGLIDNFTSTDFARKTKITRQRAATALNVLTYMSVVERIGKEKNSYIYQIKK